MNVEGLSFLRPGRASIASLVTAAACFLIVPASSFAERADAEGSVTIKIEAESYWWGHNVGGEAIGLSTCADGASGGKSVAGLDCPGDWIMMEARVPDPIVIKISLRSAVEMGLRARFAIEFIPQGPGVIPAADTLTTVPGKGAG